MPERINAYTCETCGRTIGTVDRVEGVTPMLILCRATVGCRGTMVSHMYKAPPPFVTPTFEWRKPTDAERVNCSSETLAHVDRGGLLIYPVRQEAPDAAS